MTVPLYSICFFFLANKWKVSKRLLQKPSWSRASASFANQAVHFGRSLKYLAALLLLLVPWLTDRASAAVVVLANKTDRVVTVEITVPPEQVARYQLPAGGLFPVVSFVPLKGQVSDGKTTVGADWRLNQVYEIRAAGSATTPKLEVVPLQIGTVRAGVWLIPRRKELPPTVTLPVGIYVDEEQPAKQAVWEPRLRAQVGEASRFLEWFCRVRLEVVQVGTWASNNECTTPESLLEDFRQKVAVQELRLVIGFSSQLQVPEGGQFHCQPPLLASHIILPDVQQHFSSESQLMALIHGLGHYLGAFDVEEKNSVMNPSRTSMEMPNQPEYFDPLNTLIMNLVAEELMFRDVRHVDEISSAAREYLAAVYRALGSHGRSAAFRRLAEALETASGTSQRYIAYWQNGMQVTGPEILAWGSPEDSPELLGHRLFDPDHPIRWVLDTQARAEAKHPDSWIELWAGDQMPGQVTRAFPGSVVEGDDLPAYLEVVPLSRVDWPEGPVRPTIRVLAEHVKRVVWKKTADRWTPARVYLKSGQAVAFRVLQWTEDDIRLLTSEGIQSFALQDLAEVHLPPVDPWEQVVHQRAGLTPQGNGVICEIETHDGLVATTCLERFQPRSRGDKAQPDNWFYLIQPIWSLDALWIPHRAAVWRRFFAPHEVPLVLLSPVEYRETCTLGGTWGFRRNANLMGQLMQSRERTWGWGLGVPSGSELRFPLAPLVTAFETSVGLDRQAGDGGCIRASLLLRREKEEPLFESPILLGSSKLVQVPRCSLANLSPTSELVLRVDEVAEGGPPAADPWNIRDLADWGEPILYVDQPQLDAALRQRAARFLHAWRDWQPAATAGQSAPAVSLAHYFDQTVWNMPCFRWVQVFEQEFCLERTATLPKNVRALAVVVCRPPRVPPYQIQILCGERVLAEGVVPERGGPNLPDALQADLADFAGQKVTLRIRLRGEDSQQGLQAEWRSIAFVKDDLGKTP